MQGGPPGPPPDGDRSFEDRLRDARGRRGMEPKAPAPGSDQPNAWGIGVRVGVELLAALVIAVAIGWGLDHWLHTRPVFTSIFVLLGGAAGVMNVYRMFAPGRGGR